MIAGIIIKYSGSGMYRRGTNVDVNLTTAPVSLWVNFPSGVKYSYDRKGVVHPHQHKGRGMLESKVSFSFEKISLEKYLRCKSCRFFSEFWIFHLWLSLDVLYILLSCFVSHFLRNNSLSWGAMMGPWRDNVLFSSGLLINLYLYHVRYEVNSKYSIRNLSYCVLVKIQIAIHIVSWQIIFI